MHPASRGMTRWIALSGWYALRATARSRGRSSVSAMLRSRRREITRSLVHHACSRMLCVFTSVLGAQKLPNAVHFFVGSSNCFLQLVGKRNYSGRWGSATSRVHVSSRRVSQSWIIYTPPLRAHTHKQMCVHLVYPENLSARFRKC